MRKQFYFKKAFVLLSVIVLAMSSKQVNAQVTGSGIFFQAVARDGFSNPAKDRNIVVETSLVQTAANGTVVLTERFNATTDASGVFNVSIGEGTRIGGSVANFKGIDWSKGPFFLNVKIAIAPIVNPSNWDYTKDLVDLGTSPFGAVPYALFAAQVAGFDTKMNVADTAKMLLPYAKVANLNSLVTNKVNIADSITQYVTPTQLAAKTFDQTPILNSIATKLNIADSISKYVTPAQLAAKTFDSTTIYNQLALKATTTTVNASLATKLNISDSITKYVTPAQLAAKTFDSTAIYNQLALKANTTNVNTALALKANDAAVTTALGTKENTANKSLDVSLDGTSDVKFPSVKAIKTYVDASITANTTPLTFSAPLSKSGFTVSIPQANGSNNGYLNSSDWTSFNNKIDATQKAAANGVATLGNDGKIPSVQIPAISFQNVSVVNSSSAMTSISGAQVGSIAIRTDNNNNYVLSALPASTLSNWIALATPIYVSTVNGFAGPNVVLTTNDVNEGANNKYYTDARVRGALSATAPLSFNSGTGAFSIPQASLTADGFLSATDWNTFKNKQNALVAGTDYVTPSGSITGNAGNVTGVVSVANGGTGSSTAVGALANLGAEPTANKSNDVAADAASTIKFPSVKAIKDYVDLQSANAGVADNSLTSAKINGTIAIGKGGTGATTAAAARTNLGLVIGTDVMAATATTTLTGDVTGSGNGSFATTVNSVGGITASTIAGLPTSVNANTASITANTNSIATLNTNVSANTASITANTNSITTLNTNVSANTTSITANTNSIATLNTNVSANTVSITANTNSIATLNTNVSANTASITAETTRATNAENALDTRVTSNTASITTNTADILLRAPLASPAFTGTPTAPTPLTSDNSTTLATTAYVKNSITAANAGLSSIGAISATSNAKGATISGTTELILTPADASNGGVVTTGTQTFAGSKTFTNTVTFGKDITVNGMTFGRPANPFASNSQNIAIGNNVLGKYAPTAWTTDYNIGIGYSALFNLTNGGENVAIGSTAMYLLSSGDYNTGIGSSVMSVLTTGNNNTVLGAEAGRGISTGSENTFIGSYTGVGMSGSNNILIGSNKANNYSLGTGITTGNSNTIIGSGIRSLPTTLSNNVILADGDGNIRAQHNGTTGWTLGTIVSGTWSGTTIGSNVGGAGSVNGLMKANGSGVVSAAVAGTDYLTPTGSAASLTNFPTLNQNTTGNASTATLAGDITATSNTTLTSLANLATVGIITSGTWSATEIAIAKGGTGATTTAGALTNLGAEASANKSTDITADAASTTKYPSVKTIKDYVDTRVASAGVSDGSITSAKITDGTIVNADVSTTAAIAFSKLNIAKSDITSLGIQESLTAGSGISINAGTISATGLTTSNLASNAAITNAQLANSTTTLGSTTMTLGGTVTSVTGLTSVSSTGFTGALTGNASTATALATGRSISTTGDVTYTSGNFDGTADVTGVATLAASGVSSGTYGSSTAIPVLTVDTKGRVTSASTVGIIAGVNSLNYTSTTSYAAGGTISGTSLTLAAASATNPGLISTGAQTIAGAKTFNSDVTATNFLGNATTATTAGNITATSNTTLTSLANLATVGTITSGTWSATEIAIAKGGTGATTASGARTNLGLGSIATKSTIADADVDASAAIAFSKLNITKANITSLGIQDGLTAGSGISISSGTISATGLTTSNLASNAAITNAQLANSTTTLGSTTMTLGGTVTSVIGLTSVSSTGFTGALTGNASTATKLAATKNINGVAFDGSADITIAADANTLTGTTLASNVVNSSLTSVGTITSGVWSGTAITIAKGGTGATTKTAAFDALSPMTTSGDIIYGGSSGTGTRLAKGTDGQLLTLASGVPAWTTLSAVTSLGTFTTTSYANGGTISGSTLTLSAADANNPGLVTTGTQTFVGSKTFSNTTTFNSDIVVDGINIGRGPNSNVSTNTAIGANALNSSSVLSDNVAVGYRSLYIGTNASGYNTAVGSMSGYGHSTGDYNSFFGYNAGFNSSTGFRNTIIGAKAVGYGTITGSSNQALGYSSLYNLTSGYNNTAIGDSALFSTTSGYNNVGIGHKVLKDNTTGDYNIALGLYALNSNTSGNQNIGIGGGALYTNNTGLNNIGIGYEALNFNGSYSNNIAIGKGAGKYYSSYNQAARNLADNIFIGVDAWPLSGSDVNSIVIGNNVSTDAGAVGWGSYSTSIGNTLTLKSRIYGALTVVPNTATATGNSSTIAAQNGGTNYAGGALNLIAGNGDGTGNGGNINLTPGTSTSGTAGKVIASTDMTVNGLTVGKGKSSVGYNTALGVNALLVNTTGDNNTAIGHSTLSGNYTGTQNTAIGTQALKSNTASYNTSVGYNSLYSNTTGYSNSAFGNMSLNGNTTGNNNTAFGNTALRYLSTGLDNTAFGNAAGLNSTGSQNVFIGSNAGYNTTSVSNNIFLGYKAGYYYGTLSNTNNLTGDGNIMIGTDVRPLADGQTNQVVIAGYTGSGTGMTGNGSNTVTIGNAANTANYFRGVTNIAAGTMTNTTGLDLTGSINDFFQFNVKNSSTGSQAQSGYSATADNGTNTSGFAWMGINNSTFNYPTAYNIGGANDVTYVGSGQDMHIANANNSKSIIFSTGTGSTPFFNEKMRLTNSGTLAIGTTGAAAVDSANAKLHVAGKVKIVDGNQGAGKVLTSDANGVATWTNTVGSTVLTSTASYAITLAEAYVFYTGTAAGTFSIPAAASTNAGKTIIIKNKSAYGITITPASGTIYIDNANSGAASVAIGIEASNNWIKLVSDGTQWNVLRALF